MMYRSSPQGSMPGNAGLLLQPWEELTDTICGAIARAVAPRYQIKLRLNTVGRTIITIGPGRQHGCAQHSPTSPFFERLLIVAINRTFEIIRLRPTLTSVGRSLFLWQIAEPRSLTA